MVTLMVLRVYTFMSRDEKKNVMNQYHYSHIYIIDRLLR